MRAHRCSSPFAVYRLTAGLLALAGVAASTGCGYQLSLQPTATATAPAPLGVHRIAGPSATPDGTDQLTHLIQAYLGTPSVATPAPQSALAAPGSAAAAAVPSASPTASPTVQASWQSAPAAWVAA